MDNKRLSNYIQKEKQKKRWIAVVTVLGVIASLATNAMLTNPADAMTGTLTCEKEEHTHTGECYQAFPASVNCPENAQEQHLHSENCYDAENNMICDKDEFVIIHTHDAECYDKDGSLICNLPEVEEHEHTEECYDAEGNLICGKREIREHPEHTEECYTVNAETGEKELTCTYPFAVKHQHTGACHDQVELAQICTKEEHVHTEDCYEQVEEPEEPEETEEFIEGAAETVEIAAADDTSETAEETAEEPVMEEVSEEVTEETVDVVKEATEEVTEPAAEEVTEDTADPEATEVTDQAEEPEVTIEEAAEPAEEAPEETVIAMPAVSFEDTDTDIEVYVTAEADTFPEGTVMVVTPISAEDVLGSVEEAVTNKDMKVTEIQAVDISFYYNDEEIQPAKAINVIMKPKNAIQAETTSVVHIPDEGEATVVQEAEGVQEEVQFDTPEFSVYALVGSETIEQEVTITSPDGEDVTYVVSVTYGPEALIPDGAYLEVSEFAADSPEYADAKSKVVEAKKGAHDVFDEDSLGMAAIDISIKDADGNIVEPAEGVAVNVSIQMKSLPEAVDEELLNESIEIHHLNESSGEVVAESVATSADVMVDNGTASATFTVDSFSTYTISWTDNSWPYTKTITVHYGYMDGNTFVEFDQLPEGAQTNYGGPNFNGDQLNLRYDIPGKDFVTVRVGNARTGTQISPLLQTERDSHSYWRYRVLDTLTVNGGINEWQRISSNEDYYVIYRDTPTEKSYDDHGLDPEDLSAPATNKDVDSNNDGTYDITLSVTGSSNSSVNRTHANVVIVLDTSSSMDTKDTGVANQTRLQAAQNAIDILEEELFSFNTADDPATIEVAFVDFSHRVRNEQTKDTIYSGVYGGTSQRQFHNLIHSLGNNGGTNYDTAIEAANSVLWNDADPVYVIFITDGDTVSRGYLAYDANGNTYPTDWDGGTYYNAAGGDGYLARARSAAKVQVDKLLTNTNNKFYSIGVFGTVAYLQALGGTYLGQANQEETIKQYFRTIVSQISLDLGYSDVTINDGITAMTSTTLTNGNPAEFKYYRSGGTNTDGTTPKYSTTANDGRGETWTDAPAAMYLEIIREEGSSTYTFKKNGSTNTGFTEEQKNAFLNKYLTDEQRAGTGALNIKTVVWDINLGENVLLEDGVTYTVAFTVWPSQEAYNLVADLNNGIKEYDTLPQDQKDQIIEVTAPTPTSPGTYSLRTNTTATVDYTSVRLKDGEPSGEPVSDSRPIQDPNGKMPLETQTMTLRKAFSHDINSADPYTKLTFYLIRDGEYYLRNGSTTPVKPGTEGSEAYDYYAMTLPKTPLPSEPTEDDIAAYWQNSNWSDSIYIAPGLMKGGKILETGHNYSLYEIVDGENIFEYEFTPQIVRPMNISSINATYLIKEDQYNTPTGSASTYEFNDTNKTYSTPASGDENVYYVESGNTAELVGTNRKTSELDITKIINDQYHTLTNTQLAKETFTYRVELKVPINGRTDEEMEEAIKGVTAYEYVPRLSSQYDPANNRFFIYGYQDEDQYVGDVLVREADKPNALGFADDVSRFKLKIYGAYTVTHPNPEDNRTLLKSFEKVGDYMAVTLDITLKQDEVIRFTNLPSNTEYTITEVYANLRQADPSRDIDSIPSTDVDSNLADYGYTASYKERSNGRDTGSGNGTTITGKVRKLDTRYYNQFTNSLDAKNIIEMKVTKHLSGYEWSGERYYFRLAPVGDAPMPVTINNQLYLSATSGSADRTYSFGHIRFTEPGTYQYTITELDPVTNPITYKVGDTEYTYSAIRGVTGYGVSKTVTITVNADLKITNVEGLDTTFDYTEGSEERSVTTNTTFTNTKAIEIELLKIGDSDYENKKLDGVEFELFSNAECTNKVTKDATGADIGTNGVITTANGGTAPLGMLSDGTYYLKEKSTPKGYIKLTEAISINVSNGTVHYNQASYADSSEKGPDLIYKNKATGDYVYYSKIKGDTEDIYENDTAYLFAGFRIVVNNSTGQALPMTGGHGTLAYTLSGFALILAAALMYVFRMRREERRLN